MVEYSLQLDTIFAGLADPTRRAILERVRHVELTVTEIANDYDISLAAVSKHLKILESAQLIVKRKEGRKQMVRIAPQALQSAEEYLEQYRQMWQGRYNKLEELLNKGE